MPYVEHLPPPPLRAFVDRFWTRTGVADEPQRILPDGCIDLIVASSGAPMAVGAMTRPLVIPPGASTEIIAVRFRPGGAAPFLGLPAHELTDQRIDCKTLGAGWLDQPGDLPSLQRQLLDRLGNVRPPDALIAFATRAQWRDEALSVEALAKKIGWSRQHLRRIFLAQVGLGPKLFARVARLQRALRRLQATPGANLAATAAALGYFDEAHMAQDFRELAGLTPGAVRDSRGSIFPIAPVLEAQFSSP